MKRRDFLKSVTAGVPAAASLMGPAAEASAADEAKKGPAETVRGDMRYRPFGSTGVEVSLIGLGGFHIGQQKDPKESVKIIRAAVDRGITFLDNSWDYNHGQSEIRMGNALRDGYRKKVFLMTKIDGRTRKAATDQLEESLRRLQTDHLDLIQFHEILRMEDPWRIFNDSGAMEAVQAAKKAGKVRFIGFTGHKDPEVHLRMLQVAKEHGFRFDAVQMPLNVMDAHFHSFAKKVVPVLVKEKIAVEGMKSMGSGDILKSKTVTPTECLHYAMNLPTSVVITGIDSLKILDQAFEAVKTFKPMSAEQVDALLKKTAAAARNGKYEKFKTGVRYDTTAKHPEYLAYDE
jgi:aryl-alcohol dehydrogenase-like predicted oxidoreductase